MSPPLNYSIARPVAFCSMLSYLYITVYTSLGNRWPMFREVTYEGPCPSIGPYSTI